MKVMALSRDYSNNSHITCNKLNIGNIWDTYFLMNPLHHHPSPLGGLGWGALYYLANQRKKAIIIVQSQEWTKYGQIGQIQRFYCQSLTSVLLFSNTQKNANEINLSESNQVESSAPLQRSTGPPRLVQGKTSVHIQRSCRRSFFTCFIIQGLPKDTFFKNDQNQLAADQALAPKSATRLHHRCVRDQVPGDQAPAPRPQPPRLGVLLVTMS